MSIEITLKFDTLAAAQAALSVLAEHPTPAGRMKDAPAQVVTVPAAPGPTQTNGHTAPAATNGGEPVTIEQANAAFKAYLAKGQGRTAKVAMDTIFPKIGIRSLREATPEQLAVAKHEFEEATK